MSVKTLVNDPGATLRTLPGAVLLVWRKTPDVALVNLIGQSLSEALRNHPMRFHQLNIGAADVKLPDTQAREQLSQVLKQHEASYLSATNVFLSGSFIAAALRATVRGMQLLVKPPYPVHVFGDLEEGLSHFRTQAAGLDVSPLIAAARADLASSASPP